jgi:hypothetical protein
VVTVTSRRILQPYENTSTLCLKAESVGTGVRALRLHLRPKRRMNVARSSIATEWLLR